MHVTLLSAYHGGSHQAWAEGYARNSRHRVEILSLPASFWKWRMHGGALSLAQQLEERIPRTDLVLATDMVDLATFLGLTRRRLGDTKSVLYLHENQLTYPLPEDGTTGPMRRQLGERDRHYAFINFASMRTADRVCFNSAFHRRELLAALPAFLSHYPDEKDPSWIRQIEDVAEVLPLGIDLARVDDTDPGIPALREEGRTASRVGDRTASREEDRTALQVADPTAPREERPTAPLVLWSGRWEYDKDPEAFFAALDAVAATGRAFRLAVCGANPRQAPREFLEARRRLGERVVHWGFAEEAAYLDLLRRADLVVSTARHEFFGIAVCEAMYAGAAAVLPDRLSYPDLVPAKLHGDCLYSGRGGAGGTALPVAR
ncbi:MAG: DUF3524 domain-containing protein [Candidatus Eisenbacteria bacterium]